MSLYGLLRLYVLASMYLKTEFLRLILRYTIQTYLFFILLLLDQAPYTCRVGLWVFCVLCMFVPIKLRSFCPAMKRADSCKPLTTETRLHFQANSCRIDGGQKGTGTTSSRRISFSICQHVSIKDSYSFVRMFLSFWRNSPQWARASSFTRLLDRTQRRTTVGRTPLDEWSARRRDLCLTTQHSH